MCNVLKELINILHIIALSEDEFTLKHYVPLTKPIVIVAWSNTLQFTICYKLCTTH